jgi:SAM-dependent methyltransferase
MAAVVWGRELAEVYDATYAAEFSPAVLEPMLDRLIELADTGPVLEFAVGTGRVALPLSARGVAVQAIELSPHMVERMRVKPGADAVPVTIGDMAGTRVPGSFTLVYLVANTIMNVTTQAEQVAVFANAGAHLTTGGCFLVEVIVPQLRSVPRGEIGRVFTLDPDHIGIETFDDVVRQVASSHHWLDVAGQLVKHSAPYRYVWPSELDLMAMLGGMTLRERWSDWTREPFTDASTRHISIWEKIAEPRSTRPEARIRPHIARRREVTTETSTSTRDPAVRYAFDNARAVQRERLRALEGALDPATIERLIAAGVATGWRCLEVGAGGGSVAAWLADRVGATGEVLATDLDITVARERVHPALTVEARDLLSDPLPEAHFDLAHARLLVSWLPERDRALRTLTNALRPGGLLLVEEFDFVAVVPTGRAQAGDVETFARVMQAHLPVLRERHGYDPYYGRRLPAELADAGLEAVDASCRASIWRGGDDGMRIWQLTFAQLRGELIATGVAAGDVDRAVELCDDPGVAFVAPLVVAAWGRRPASRPA